MNESTILIKEAESLIENNELTKEKLLDLQFKVIQLGSSNAILRFAERVPEVNIELLEDELLKIPNSKSECIIFAFTIPKARIMKLINGVTKEDLEKVDVTIKKRGEELGFDGEEFYKLIEMVIGK